MLLRPTYARIGAQYGRLSAATALRKDTRCECTLKNRLLLRHTPRIALEQYRDTRRYALLGTYRK